MKKLIILPVLLGFLVLNIVIVFAADSESADAPEESAASEQIAPEPNEPEQNAPEPNVAAETNPEASPAPVPEEQAAPAQDEQKNRLHNLFKAVKEKSRAIKPAKYEVTLPVSTAGARGAETRQADRFAVIWPDTEISPLTALVENIENAVAAGQEKSAIAAQLDEFKKVFPEYNDHELLTELAGIINTEM